MADRVAPEKRRSGPPSALNNRRVLRMEFPEIEKNVLDFLMDFNFGD